MDFQIGKYMKVDKRLNYFRRNIGGGNPYIQVVQTNVSTDLHRVILMEKKNQVHTWRQP